MIIGVPKEIKRHEYRVGMTPNGVRELTSRGHTVLVEYDAGVDAGFSNESYEVAGAKIDPFCGEIWSQADMIVKVKEPQLVEIPLLRHEQLVFTYFHFAADFALTEGVIGSECTAIAYETLLEAGNLPLLTPMSEVAGRMSVQEGAKCLEKPQRGRGVLLGGVPGVEPARVAVIGGGVVGVNAAKIAAGFGAHVTILDTNLDRLRYLDQVMPANVTTLFSERQSIQEQLTRADMIVGAALVPGAKAPSLITRDDLKTMKPGAVLVDVAIDQGGIAETSRPTTHDAPTYVVDNVVHYCVANIPGAVPSTSTRALCNATLPYVLTLAENGLNRAADRRPSLVSAVNVHHGKVTHPAVARTFGLPYTPFNDARLITSSQSMLTDILLG